MNQIRTKRKEQEEEKADPVKAQDEKAKRELLTGKKEGPWKGWDFFIDELKHKQANDMAEAEKALYDDHKTNESLVMKWLE